MFVSCLMDLVEFPGLKAFAFLVASAQSEIEVYGDDSEMQDSQQMGTIITSMAQRTKFLEAIQELRGHYKSSIQKYPVSNHSVTKIFVPTKFPEDGNDGEHWDGVNLTITYRWTQNLEFIEVHVENGYVTQNPNLNGRC
jgi:hypothetical protein